MLNIEFQTTKPALSLDVRYFPKGTDANERVSLTWKSRGPQPSWRALKRNEQHQLLDLLLKLSRSAYPAERRAVAAKPSKAKRAIATAASEAP
jgi:hypothetical protein